jgi:Sigma-70, region 4/Protein of unknown function (DUF1559)
VRAKVASRRQRQQEERGAEMKATSQLDLAPREELEALHEEIGRLPEKYRSAVVLCHLEGCTHAEAARVLKCPTGTVNVRVSRARELLRDRLARRGLAFSTALAGAALVGEAATAAMPVGLAETTIKAAMQVAAGKTVTAGAGSAAVAQLTEGVLKTMTLTKITIAAALVLTVGSVSSGIALLAMSSEPRPAHAVAAAASSAQDPNAQQEKSRPKAGKKERDHSINNLKMIALAMHNFASRTDDTRFAPAAIRKDGKPLLSWRVALLPDLGQRALYDRFHLDEPWNSPHNKTLLNQMPDVYAPVVRTDEPRGSTYYQVFTGPGALFEDELGPKLLDVKDGTSNTMMVVEAGSPVPWTKPEDISYDKEKPLPKLGRQFDDGFHASFADGSVQFFGNAKDPNVVRLLITSNGGETITPDMVRSDPQPPEE